MNYCAGGYLERREGVRSDVKIGHLDELEEFPELRRIHDQLGEGLVFDALTQHGSACLRHLREFVPV